VAWAAWIIKKTVAAVYDRRTRELKGAALSAPFYFIIAAVGDRGAAALHASSLRQASAVPKLSYGFRADGHGSLFGLKFLRHEQNRD